MEVQRREREGVRAYLTKHGIKKHLQYELWKASVPKSFYEELRYWKKKSYGLRTPLTAHREVYGVCRGELIPRR